MRWNWQQKDWPSFSYDAGAMAPMESEFLKDSGVLVGTFRHLEEQEKERLTIDLISEEAFKTSEIEGEMLNRDSLQSSIRRHFGLQTDGRRVRASEEGIAELMVDMFRTFGEELNEQALFTWHQMVTNGRRDLKDCGCYRTHEEVMQVVSGPIDEPLVHFEAPPSSQVESEMGRFLVWYNHSGALPSLTRSGIAHLYFISIHPFEDGNGRIGRAIAEKAIAQNLGQPSLLALSVEVEKNRNAYYDALAAVNKHNEISPWLSYWGQLVLDAQKSTILQIDFLIKKAKFYYRCVGLLNERQSKVIARIFREGPDGFKGGLSSENYVAITKASTATATRDLTRLVEAGLLWKRGKLKTTRYGLILT